MIYIACAEDETEEPTELPLEPDMTLAMSTLQAQYPGASGLKFRSPETGSWRGLRVTDGKVFQEDNDWGTHLYVTVYPKNKRRGDMDIQDSQAKTKRVDIFRRCTDLIVLGLPWKTTEDDMKDYFGQFGEVVMAQVKKDLETGKSRGYGFIKFKDYDVQQAVIGQRHNIDGRWCDVRVPNSKGGDLNSEISKKIFVGRVSEDLTKTDLKDYFSKFGEVTDVFIPKPHRAFAFVTFSDALVAQVLQAEGEDHLIKNCSVNISNATAKNRRVEERDHHGPRGGFGMGHGAGGGGGGFGAPRDGMGMVGGGGGGGGGMDMNSMMNPMMQTMMQMMMNGMMANMSGGNSGGGGGGGGSSGVIGDKFGSNRSMGFGGFENVKNDGYGGWRNDGKSASGGGGGGGGGFGWQGPNSPWNN